MLETSASVSKASPEHHTTFTQDSLALGRVFPLLGIRVELFLARNQDDIIFSKQLLVDSFLRCSQFIFSYISNKCHALVMWHGHHVFLFTWKLPCFSWCCDLVLVAAIWHKMKNKKLQLSWGSKARVEIKKWTFLPKGVSAPSSLFYLFYNKRQW